MLIIISFQDLQIKKAPFLEERSTLEFRLSSQLDMCICQRNSIFNYLSKVKGLKFNHTRLIRMLMCFDYRAQSLELSTQEKLLKTFEFMNHKRVS